MAIPTNLDIVGVSYNGTTIPVSGGGGTPNLQTKNKSYTPTESQQTEAVSADSGYDGLDTVNVTVGAISSSYVGSGITRRDSSDLSASGATVSVPAGYYESAASKAVPSGTEGTPTATKGTVSNHSVSVTPSVTNSAGYVSGGTHSGTPVSVSASELVSGTKNITANGSNIDVTDYSAVDVAVPASTVDSGTKSITANGNNQDVVGYAAVDVNVPNSYSAVDEGKVVSNGALVSQGSDTVTTNGTVDTTLINSLTVNVPSSGGYTLLASGTYTRTSGTNLSIPVSYSGTPKIALLRVNTPKASTNQGYLVQKYFVTSDEAGYGLLNNAGMAYAVGLKSDGTYAAVAYSPTNMTLSATTLGVNRISNTYAWQNTTYDWYIYGNA